MKLLSHSISLSVGVLFASSLAGCFIDDSPPRRYHHHDDGVGEVGGTPAPAPTTTGGTSSGGSAPPSGKVAPMLVEVDTDKTMTAEPGDGVGVFVEYAKGGRWHVWWTCDTAKTQQDCDFKVSITAGSGTIANLDATQLEGGTVATPTETRLEAKSKTTTQTHGVAFTTNAGAAITLEAAVGDIVDGTFLFFVQDGKVNGGFTGKLTNPLQLQGKTP